MIRCFLADDGCTWCASAREEQTPRHHTRWYLVFHEEGNEDEFLPAPEVRWQTQATARRTIASMSEFELKKRLASVQRRAGSSGSGGSVRAS